MYSLRIFTDGKSNFQKKNRSQIFLYHRKKKGSYFCGPLGNLTRLKFFS